MNSPTARQDAPRPSVPWLLVGATLIAPLAAALHYILHASPIIVFGTGGIAIAIFAEWMRRSTDQVAIHTGPAVGGLLTVSFGSAAELILALFVIRDGHVDVVRAQITGSIMGTSLLGVGLACFLGGLGRVRQRFSTAHARLQSSLLLIVMLALLLPAIFDRAETARVISLPARQVSELDLSIGVSVVLLTLYAGNLAFTLFTHRDMFASGNDDEEIRPREAARWSLMASLAILVAATIGVAGCAEFVSSALQETASRLHLPLLFVGVVPLALIGTAADLFAAVGFARQDRIGLVMSICVGSTIQVGLVVAPLLVLISWAIGSPMTLVFPSLLDLFAIIGAVLVCRSIAADGETNWFEGLMLVGIYVLFAMAFFFASTPD